MTTEHPITPPLKLMQQWADKQDFPTFEDIATQAARWGADQQLKADCEWLREARNHGFGYDMGRILADNLRAARRPKPPSLAEQALDVIENSEICDHLSPEHAAILRRALEALDD